MQFIKHGCKDHEQVWEIAQGVECLYKHENEDLNSDPQQPSENPGMTKWT